MVFVYIILAAIALLIIVLAGAIAFPFILAIAVATAIYTVARTVFEHNGWKTYLFDGASGVAIVIVLTFLILLIQHKKEEISKGFLLFCLNNIQHTCTTFYERGIYMDIDDLIFADEDYKRHSTK